MYISNFLSLVANMISLKRSTGKAEAEERLKLYIQNRNRKNNNLSFDYHRRK